MRWKFIVKFHEKKDNVNEMSTDSFDILIEI